MYKLETEKVEARKNDVLCVGGLNGSFQCHNCSSSSNEPNDGEWISALYGKNILEYHGCLSSQATNDSTSQGLRVPHRYSQQETARKMRNHTSKLLKESHNRSKNGLHTDISVLRSMLNQRDEELRILQEDAVAKGSELINVLKMLHLSQSRESELRYTGSNLEQQLHLLQEALEQSDTRLENLQNEFDDLMLQYKDAVPRQLVDEKIEGLAMELAESHTAAEKSSLRAAKLESALAESQHSCYQLQEQLARIKSCISQIQDKNCDLNFGSRDCLGRRKGITVVKPILQCFLLGHFLCRGPILLHEIIRIFTHQPF